MLPFYASQSFAHPLTVQSDGLTQTTITDSLDCSTHCTITGRSRLGDNLFHSFSRFSIAEGVSATFEDSGAANIFASVSDELSTINGTLAVTGVGNANLFLINPRGIVFGPKATLSLEGSFIASSAERINFSNGAQFSSSHHLSPSLSVSTPVGLQFGARPGSVTNYAQSGAIPRTPIEGPVNSFMRPSGLRVADGKTLALVGQGVFLEAGTLTANSGRVEVGSVAAHSNLSLFLAPESPQRIELGYEAVSEFADIHFTQSSQINVSGDRGEVIVRGENISFSDQSSVTNFTSKLDRAGKIEIIAGERIELDSSFVFFPQALGDLEDGVALDVVANQLGLRNGSVLVGATIGPVGKGGNITINAREFVEMTGANELTTNYISASSFGGGASGNIAINTRRLLVADGSQIESLTAGSGPGGDVEINATQINVVGAAPALTPPVATRLFTGVGLVLEATSTAPSVSKILATSGIEEVDSRQATGLGGSLNISADTLSVSDRAQITVGSFGFGNSGDLDIVARNVRLNNQAQLSAASVLGDGGNLRLDGLETLILRQGSRVSAQSGGGSGGNIFINSDFVIAQPLEDSDIIASAINGPGGNIEIDTQGMYGLKPRMAVFGNGTSDIDASSAFGVSGTTAISVATSEVGIVPLTTAVQPLDETATVTQRCGASGNRFVVSARGGIPLSPLDTLSAAQPLIDTRFEHSSSIDPSVSRATVNVGATNTGANNQMTADSEFSLVEASGWQRDRNGQISLMVSTMQTGTQIVNSPTSCSGR